MSSAQYSKGKKDGSLDKPKESAPRLIPAFREIGPVEEWPEPEQREPARGLCAPSIHLMPE